MAVKYQTNQGYYDEYGEFHEEEERDKRIQAENDSYEEFKNRYKKEIDPERDSILRPLGYNGPKLRVVSSVCRSSDCRCAGCYYEKIKGCGPYQCNGIFRKDNNDVIFELIKDNGQTIKTWDDLHGKGIPWSCVQIDTHSEIKDISDYEVFCDNYRNVFYDEKNAKSALAMAQISQLMPYYGKTITDKEWNDIHLTKYVISRVNNAITKNALINTYFFLAFHTAEQRDSFLKYNEQLVKDYLMIE